MSTVKIIFLGVDKDTHLAYNDPAYENQRYKKWFALLQLEAK
jgi:hypothetical protein